MTVFGALTPPKNTHTERPFSTSVNLGTFNYKCVLCGKRLSFYYFCLLMFAPANKAGFFLCGKVSMSRVITGAVNEEGEQGVRSKAELLRDTI